MRRPARPIIDPRVRRVNAQRDVVQIRVGGREVLHVVEPECVLVRGGHFDRDGVRPVGEGVRLAEVEAVFCDGVGCGWDCGPVDTAYPGGVGRRSG